MAPYRTNNGQCGHACDPAACVNGPHRRRPRLGCGHRPLPTASVGSLWTVHRGYAIAVLCTQRWNGAHRTRRFSALLRAPGAPFPNCRLRCYGSIGQTRCSTCKARQASAVVARVAGACERPRGEPAPRAPALRGPVATMAHRANRTSSVCSDISETFREGRWRCPCAAGSGGTGIADGLACCWPSPVARRDLQASCTSSWRRASRSATSRMLCRCTYLTRLVGA